MLRDGRTPAPPRLRRPHGARLLSGRIRPTNSRRAGGGVLQDLLQRIWSALFDSCGPKSSDLPRPAHFAAEAAEALSWKANQDLAGLRAQRRRLKYGLRATLGKWEYWVSSVAFLCNAVEAFLLSCQDFVCLSANAVKCAIRFLDQSYCLEP